MYPKVTVRAGPGVSTITPWTEDPCNKLEHYDPKEETFDLYYNFDCSI